MHISVCNMEIAANVHYMHTENQVLMLITGTLVLDVMLLLLLSFVYCSHL